MSLYVEDYLGKTQRLSAAEHGAYLLLIMEYWQTRSLPDDDAQLARICRMSDREWKKARPVIAPFFTEGWRHHRIDEELAKADRKHQKRVEAGSAGGAAKALADAKARQKAGKRPSIATHDAMASSPEPTATEEAAQLVAKPREEAPLPERAPPPIDDLALPTFLDCSIAPSRKAELDEIERQLREAAGLENDISPALLDLSPIIGLMDAGYRLAEDILTVIRAKTRPGVKTWRYFVPAIEQAKRANQAIAPKPTEPEVKPVVWIHNEQPEWAIVSARWQREKGKPPPAMGSRNGREGQGHYFPAEWLSVQPERTRA